MRGLGYGGVSRADGRGPEMQDKRDDRQGIMFEGMKRILLKYS